jgi:hypothetical protein
LQRSDFLSEFFRNILRKIKKHLGAPRKRAYYFFAAVNSAGGRLFNKTRPRLRRSEPGALTSRRETEISEKLFNKMRKTSVSKVFSGDLK